MSTSTDTDELRLEIDEFRLDQEWMDQPKQVRYWNDKLAESRMNLDQAETALSVAKAKASNLIREDPMNNGLTAGKVTEEAIKVALPAHPLVITADGLVSVVRRQHGMIQATCLALEHRKKALQDLVYLFGLSYFSEPRAPRGREEEVSTAEKKLVRRRGVRKESDEDE